MVCGKCLGDGGRNLRLKDGLKREACDACDGEGHLEVANVRMVDEDGRIISLVACIPLPAYPVEYTNKVDHLGGKDNKEIIHKVGDIMRGFAIAMSQYGGSANHEEHMAYETFYLVVDRYGMSDWHSASEGTWLYPQGFPKEDEAPK